MKVVEPAALARKLAEESPLWLFLDYDGTLADFAPTPDEVYPDPELIDLLEQLAGLKALRAAVISGRRLSHIEKLVPVKGIILAGSYGVEMLVGEAQRFNHLDLESLRPTLEALKPHWAALLDSRKGFFLEDKGWSLAIHARFAEPAEAAQVLAEARQAAAASEPVGSFRLLGGHKFLEISPTTASKAEAVAYLMKTYPWPEARPVFIGDDDKDEEAFAAVQRQAGIAVVVAREPRPSRAEYRLASPQATRQLLGALADILA